MRLVIGALVVATAACGGGDDDFPVGGGSDGSVMFPDTGGGSGSDAGTDGSSGIDGSITPSDAPAIDGRVCLLTDPRVLDQCASTGASGLTVRLGDATAVTGDDGSFTIAGQGGQGLVWRITGPNIVSSYEVLADYFIPAMPQATFDSLLTANSIMQVPGEGSVFVFVSRDGAGLSGQVATSAPEGFYKPRYDGATATAWSDTTTGANGAVWIAGVDVGSVTVTVSGVPTTAPIFDGGITFANILIP
jgi:hypothetical protein